MILNIEPRNADPESNGRHDHHSSQSDIGELFVLQEVQEGGDIMGHLRGGGGGTVIILEHAIMELLRLNMSYPGHTDDHMMMVGVEVPAFRDLMAKGRDVVIGSQNIVYVSSMCRVVLRRSG